MRIKVWVLICALLGVGAAPSGHIPVDELVSALKEYTRLIQNSTAAPREELAKQVSDVDDLVLELSHHDLTGPAKGRIHKKTLALREFMFTHFGIDQAGPLSTAVLSLLQSHFLEKPASLPAVSGESRVEALSDALNEVKGGMPRETFSQHNDTLARITRTLSELETTYSPAKRRDLTAMLAREISDEKRLVGDIRAARARTGSPARIIPSTSSKAGKDLDLEAETTSAVVEAHNLIKRALVKVSSTNDLEVETRQRMQQSISRMQEDLDLMLGTDQQEVVQELLGAIQSRGAKIEAGLAGKSQAVEDRVETKPARQASAKANNSNSRRGPQHATNPHLAREQRVVRKLQAWSNEARHLPKPEQRETVANLRQLVEDLEQLQQADSSRAWDSVTQRVTEIRSALKTKQRKD